MKIFDTAGNERDWVWLEANYGPIVIHPANPGLGWRVAEIWERADIGLVRRLDLRVIETEDPDAPATQIVTMRQEDGSPAEGVEVAFYWPDAPEDPNAGPVNGVPEGMIPNRCVYGATNANGDIGFGMGPGSYYSPPDIGPHAVWARGAETNSEVVFGLGMLAGTEHFHLDVVFQWGEAEPVSGRARGMLLRSNEPLTLAELQAAWDEGYRFVEVRASVGLTADVAFARHWEYAGAVGFLRAASHNVHPTQNGQAAFFHSVVGDRVPELGIIGILGGDNLTLEKANKFLQATDRNFGQTCNVRCRTTWLDPLGTPPWEAEGRKLTVTDTSGAEQPDLPNAYTTWEFWLHARQQVPPFPVSLYLYRYNGTVADLYAEYGGMQQVIAELLLAQAKNAEIAAHVATALAILQGGL